MDPVLASIIVVGVLAILALVALLIIFATLVKHPQMYVALLGLLTKMVEAFAAFLKQGGR